MTQVIVRNSLDKPFGKLANDAEVPLAVKTEDYSSVINYVYSNLLPFGTFREELMATPPSRVLSTFIQMRKHIKKSIIQSSAHTAIMVESERDPVFRQALLETSPQKIVYKSNNKFMGVGEDGTGDNIYGAALEQVRNELQAEKDRDAHQEAVYLAYIAEVNLKKALRKHNLEKYISKDRKRSIKRLVDALVQDYGKTQVFDNSPDIDTIMTLHEKRNIMVYTDPNALIRIVRKNTIRAVLAKNLLELRVAALNAFVDYAISKNVVRSEDKSRLKDQLFDIELGKRNDFSKRILDLFEAKALPDEIKNVIKKFKAQWYFPRDDEIEHFERETVKIPVPQATTTQQATAEPAETYTVSYDSDSVLSPLRRTQALNLNMLLFPTISHFIAFEVNKKYELTSIRGLYDTIKKIPIRTLDAWSKTHEQQTMEQRKLLLLEEAITHKLMDYSVKHLVWAIRDLKFEDKYNPDETTQIYRKYMDKINLRIQKIPSFEEFVEKDPMVHEVVREKVDFYFTILDNLMVHTKYKFNFKVSYDDLVKMSPFHGFILMDSVQISRLPIPDYLQWKNSRYGLSTESLVQIWTIVYNGLKQSEKLVGINDWDIRYKSCFIWAKYLLGQEIRSRRLNVMESRREDEVLLAILSVLFKLKEVNLRFGLSALNFQDLQTALYLCLGRVRQYVPKGNKPDLRPPPTLVADSMFDQPDIQLAPLVEPEEEVDETQVEIYEPEQMDDQEYNEYDYYRDYDEEFEGFNLNARKKFGIFFHEFYAPLENKIQLPELEDAINSFIKSSVPRSVKNQNLNFFITNFRVPDI
ncbi:hypothetical protein MIV113L [Invertebrate iridescent virus 3]|uniref:Uncharacterized protein 113L n=1 Tax=Invertebrate iridescent virus 3 TaxID=345201 RepID=VF155_IIV3|nr:hypothetical protein MIV113L [Invertebrate iridescent virus 3]Q196U7.1 RecName: Full=Uncharacterized protein 113L [Invertebrate iridescent virus 3]ABF82143.1 hypothetical protein MIV113L [Invertebrate iridescent virus 3]